VDQSAEERQKEFEKQGLVAIPPKHVLHAERLEVPRDVIRRRIDLTRTTDQQALVESIRSPEYRELLSAHLETYLRFFVGPEWRTITQGRVVRRVGERRIVALDILYLMEIAANLARLERLPGFAVLLENLRNPSQTLSTLFEIEAANFAFTRRITRSVEFAQRQLVEGRWKNPEFVWRTLLGDVVCECKRAEFMDSVFNRRLSELMDLAKNLCEAELGWPPQDLRLDVNIAAAPRPLVEREIRELIRGAADSARTGVARDFTYKGRALTAAFSPQSSVLEMRSETIRTSQATITPSGAQLGGGKSAHITVTMELRKYRQKATSTLASEARRQIPRDKLGGLFLNVGSVEGAPVDKMLSLLSLPEYERTPFAFLSSQGRWVLVHRNGQPFDQRLTE
jgi:hypothetical protein